MRKLFAILLLTVCNAVAANNLYSVRLLFSSNPADGDSFTVNGVTRTFESGTITTPGSQIAIGATPVDTAANALLQIQEHPLNKLTPFVNNTTNIVLVADELNFAVTASHVGSWGGVTVTVTGINAYTAQLPLSSVLPLTHRTNLANWEIIGLRDYATTNFPAGSGLLVHYADDASTQTIGGAKTFTGANVYSNTTQRFDGGVITNVDLYATYAGIDSAYIGVLVITNGINYFSTSPKFFFTDTDEAATNEANTEINGEGGEFVIKLWNYLHTDSKNLLRMSRNGYEPEFIDFPYGTARFNSLIATNFTGTITNATIGAGNAYITNIFLQGPIYITNTLPFLGAYDSDGAADNKWLRLIMENGDFQIALADDTGSTFAAPFQVERTGTSVDYVKVEAPFWVVGDTEHDGSIGISGVLMVGDLVASPPTGMSTGLQLTNSVTEASTDPANSGVFWVYGGEAKYRLPSSGVNHRLHNAAAQVQGAGTDYSLTGSYAQVTFGSGGNTLSLPSAGTYLVNGIVTVDQGGTANDNIAVKFYNATTAADVVNSERQNSSLDASTRGQISMGNVITVTSATTLHLYAKNLTAARGSIDSEQTSLSYVRLY